MDARKSIESERRSSGRGRGLTYHLMNLMQQSAMNVPHRVSRYRYIERRVMYNQALKRDTKTLDARESIESDWRSSSLVLTTYVPK